MGVVPAIIGSAVVGGAASIAGGSMAAGAATDAARLQSEAAKYSADIQKQIYDITRNDLSPFTRLGTGAMNNLNSLISGGVGLGPNNRLSLGGGQAGGGVEDPSNPRTITQNTPAGPITIPNPNYDPSKAPAEAPDFDITSGAGGDSRFLTGLQSFLYGQGDNPAFNALRRLSPGGGGPDTPEDPIIAAIRGYVSGAPPNEENRNLLSFIPGSGQPLDPSLTALNSFSDGTNQDLVALNSLLGIGKGGGFDPGLIQQALESTPGYQFVRDQGLKSVQNSFAAKGLGNSGAAMRGAADYTTGLANSTYEQRVQDYLNNYNSKFTNTLNTYTSKFDNALNARNTGFTNTSNLYNSLFTNALNNFSTQGNLAYNTYGQQLGAVENLLSLGQNAAAQTGAIGQKSGEAIGNTLVGGANAVASGIVGSTKAITNALTGTATTFGNAGIAAALYGGGGTPLTSAYGNPGGPATNQLTGMYGASIR